MSAWTNCTTDAGMPRTALAVNSPAYPRAASVTTRTHGNGTAQQVTAVYACDRSLPAAGAGIVTLPSSIDWAHCQGSQAQSCVLWRSNFLCAPFIVGSSAKLVSVHAPGVMPSASPGPMASPLPRTYIPLPADGESKATAIVQLVTQFGLPPTTSMPLPVSVSLGCSADILTGAMSVPSTPGAVQLQLLAPWHKPFEFEGASCAVNFTIMGPQPSVLPLTALVQPAPLSGGRGNSAWDSKTLEIVMGSVSGACVLVLAGLYIRRRRLLRRRAWGDTSHEAGRGLLRADGVFVPSTSRYS